MKPKPKAKAKVKAVPLNASLAQGSKTVPIQPVNNEVIPQTGLLDPEGVIHEEPTHIKEVKQRILQEPKQPVIMKSPYEQIMDNYSIIHQEYLNKKREKVNNLCANKFSGDLRKKKR